MKVMRTLLLSIIVISLTACAGIRPEPPEVQLSGLEITDLSLSHVNFLASLKLFNPNSVGLDIEGLRFTLHLNDVRVATGQTAQAFHIPAEEFGEAAIRLSSSFLNLLQLTGKLQGQSEIAFRLAGEVRVGGLGILGATIPIDHEGHLPLTGSLNRLSPSSSRQSDNGLQEQILRQ